MKKILIPFCQSGGKIGITSLVFLIALMVQAHAAAINYMVLTGAASISAAGTPTASLAASISTTCPLIAGNASGYAHYGFADGLAFDLYASSHPVAIPSQSGTICLAGVPSTVTLRSAGALGFAPITLTAGGAAQSLLMASIATGAFSLSATSGIALPDGTIISVYAGTNSNYGWEAIFLGREIGGIRVGSGNSSPNTFSDANGLLCFYHNGPGANYSGACATYLMGY